MLLLHAWSLGAELLQGRIRAGQIPGLASEAGFSGVEWLDRLLPSFREDGLRALGRAQERAGLTDAALSLCLEFNAPTSWVNEQLQLARGLLNKCSLLNIKTVRLSIGQPGLISLGRGLMLLERVYPRRIRRQRPLGGLSKLAYRAGLGAIKSRRHQTPARAACRDLERAASLLRPLARCGQEQGLKLGIENHFGLTSHAEDLAALVDLCGYELGICLDTGNFLPGQDPDHALAQWAGRIKHVHLKVKQADPDWEGLRSYADGIVRQLTRQGYRGGCSVEYEGRGGALQHAARAARIWRDLLAEHQG
jgi:sugar phosphate isomerase/epimerase